MNSISEDSNLTKTKAQLLPHMPYCLAIDHCHLEKVWSKEELFNVDNMNTNIIIISSVLVNSTLILQAGTLSQYFIFLLTEVLTV